MAGYLITLNCTAQVADEHNMSTEHCWSDADRVKREYTNGNLSQSHIIYKEIPNELALDLTRASATISHGLVE
jgi:hypothetical protein